MGLLRDPKLLAAALLAVVLGLLAAGCGGSDDDGSNEPTPPPSAQDFPQPEGTLEDLIAETTATNDLVVAPAGVTFTQGENRFGFAVFTVDGEQVPDASVAIYVAPGPTGRAQGPFTARSESLATEAAFTAQTTSGDPDAAKNVYVTELDLPDPGEWRAVAVIEQDGELLSTRVPSLVVRGEDPIPEVGDRAIEVHTPTADDVGNIAEIDTRVPPGTMHDVDLAEVLGRKPVVLLFATPALCTSRVCGPVVDAAEQVKRETGDDVAFIHQEIYEDNKPPKLRSQVSDWHLRTEPWLFVIDRDGEVSTRIEGAFSVDELESAVAKVE